MKTNNKIEITNLDNKGIAEVLNAFVKLYKVCENKKLIDKAFKQYVSPFIFKT